MRLFQLLANLDPSVSPELCKVHLARWNNIENPLDVYLAGGFDEWQSYQTKRNFQRPLVVSLIALATQHRWLFAGVHDVHGCKPHRGPAAFRYETTRRASTDPLRGRLVVAFERPGRQSYLLGERWEDHLLTAEIRSEELQILDFPGYMRVNLTHKQLQIIVGQQVISWRAALSAVAGVYVITDAQTGKHYVGSAVGGEGLWGRWCAYANTGHGGNKELRDLLRDRPAGYASNFRYGILETADCRASRDDVLARESHWMTLLLTREHGHNAN